MDSIDFSSLSFKIRKPSIHLSDDPHPNSMTDIKLTTHSYIGFEDTQASNGQQQTINPFRRTCHLFKHIENEKKSLQKSHSHSRSHSKIQWTISSRSQPYMISVPMESKEQVAYSLQNFNSFNNSNQSKEILAKNNESGKNNESKRMIKNENDFIKIQGSSYQYQDDLSLIMDDFNCEMRTSDLIPSYNTRKIKTQYQENEEQQKMYEDKKGKKKQSRIFCLTAQQESSQSNVKEFYFDLREQKQKLKTREVPNHEIKNSIKKQLEQLMYGFIEHLNLMDENQIDPDFYDKLQTCLFTAKKIPPLEFGAALKQKGKWEITPEKQIKTSKNPTSNKSYNKIIEQKANLSRVHHISGNKNKNKENTVPIRNIVEEGDKNMKGSHRNLEQTSHGAMRKRKWVF